MSKNGGMLLVNVSNQAMYIAAEQVPFRGTGSVLKVKVKKIKK